MATGSGRILANLSIMALLYTYILIKKKIIIMALLCFSRWREENRR